MNKNKSITDTEVDELQGKRIKIVLVGDQNVGKSALAKVFCGVDMRDGGKNSESEINSSMLIYAKSITINVDNHSRFGLTIKRNGD